jgi:AcrR family transcriptional regulator
MGITTFYNMNERSFIIAMTKQQDRKNRIAEQRKKQILNAALSVFSRRGFDGATIPDIAQEAGVAVGTIYNYYQSKRELFIAVIQNLIFTTPLLSLFEKISANNFPATFKDILQDRLDLSESSNMTRLISLMGEIQRDPKLKAMYLEQLIQPTMSRIEAFYSTMIESGKIRRLEPAVIVRAIGGMIIGIIILKSLEGEASPLSWLPQEKAADNLVSFVLYGLQGKVNDKEKDTP